MKVYLSLRKTKAARGFPILTCFFIFLVIIVMNQNNIGGAITLSMITMFALLLDVLIFKQDKNFLTYMIFEQDNIKLYSFSNRLIQTVDLNEKVYYHIFGLLDDNKADYAKAICISNDEKSLLKAQSVAIKYKYKFFENCDFNGYIAMYYNETTEEYLRFDEWEKA